MRRNRDRAEGRDEGVSVDRTVGRRHGLNIEHRTRIDGVGDRRLSGGTTGDHRLQRRHEVLLVGNGDPRLLTVGHDQLRSEQRARTRIGLRRTNQEVDLDVVQETTSDDQRRRQVEAGEGARHVRLQLAGVLDTVVQNRNRRPVVGVAATVVLRHERDEHRCR